MKNISGVIKKNDMLLKLAEVSLNNPDGIIKNVVYPIAGTDTLKNLISELQSSSHTYQAKVYSYFRKSYSGHYRRMIPLILNELVFRSNNDSYQPLIKAIETIRSAHSKRFLDIEDIPIENVLKQNYQNIVIEQDEEGTSRINRINYEIGVLQSLRDKLRCKEIWVEGAGKYGDPDKDLPSDFDLNRDKYYEALQVPKEADEFIEKLKTNLSKALLNLNNNLPKNPLVAISNKDNGWIHLAKSEPQAEPVNLPELKKKISNIWPMTSLLDVLKEADIRINFSDLFKSIGNREILDRNTLQKRILMALYGLGTNTGLKRVLTTDSDITYKNLLHIENKYITADSLRNANAEISNAIFKVRKLEIWGPASTTCASDSKQFGSWDQNLRTEWHNRYHGRGIMIYWHVENGATCIHSQVKTCSSSEVASMIEGLIRHNTTMKIEKNFTDTHGQSLVAFAFTHILGFHLMPRFKAIHSQKLFLPDLDHKDKLKNLTWVLAKNSIDWDLIKQNYDQIIKYTTAIRLGTADTDTILKRFTKNSVKHPVYFALQELGKVIKTIFLCHYLDSEALRVEIHEGLNIVENWNSATTFIFFAKGSTFASNNLENQEISMLALHLLQNCLVYINTLMIQAVLADDKLFNSFKEEDFRALTPLIYEHINPYGIFELNMDERIDIKEAA